MKPTGRNAKPASPPKTGRFAPLQGAPRVNGSGAPARAARRAFPAVFAALLVLAFTSATAQAARQHTFELSFGSEGGANGEFVEPAGVAVNESLTEPSAGQVYVSDKGNNRVEWFSASGEYKGQFDGTATPAKSLAGPEGIAVDNSGETVLEDPSAGDIYVADSGHDVVDRFSPTGTYQGQLAEACENVAEPAPCAGSKPVPLVGVGGVAVDAQGNVWVAEFEGGRVDEFNPTGEYVSGFDDGYSYAHAIAADATGNIYVARGPVGSPNPVEHWTETGGAWSPHKAVGGAGGEVAVTGLALDSASDALLVDETTTIAEFNPTGSSTEPTGVLQETFGSGRIVGGVGVAAVNSTSGQVYVADAAADRVELFTLEPPSAPIVDSESVSEVTNDSAMLNGDVNPHSLSSEPATEYQFEYITEAAYQANLQAALPPFAGAARAPVPAGSVSPEFEDETVSPVTVQGLSAGTVYRYRLIAHDQNGVAEGERGGQGEEVARAFTTSRAGEFVLPDGRQWELVSPPDKHGAVIEPLNSAETTGAVVQAAASGDAITYVANRPTESNPEGYSLFQQVLSTRRPNGWSSRDIEPPHVNATGLGLNNGQEFRFFSEDLSSAVVQPFGAFDQAYSGEASEPTAFRRTNFPAGDPGELCTSSCLHPLVTGAPGLENVPAGTAFGEEQACPPKLYCGPEFVDGTGDLSHIILRSEVLLKANAVKQALYEWSAGKPPGEQLSLVSVLPDGEAREGSVGSLEEADTRGAISEDGSRVLWIEGAGTPGSHLYLRINATEPQSPVSGNGCTVAADACTIELDEGLVGPPTFQSASKGVAGVLFTDGGDLYEYVVAERRLKRLTEHAEVLGLVIGGSSDDSYVYFVAQGVLGDASEHGATQGNCQEGAEATSSQRCNLYVIHDGVVKLVAVMSGRDHPDWGGSGGQLSLEGLTDRVSPDGERLAFMSQRSLTGYDNRDAVSGQADEEVFEYNAASGRVVCASCNPTGARPHGVEYLKEGFIQEMPLAGGSGMWLGSTWLAANVPGWTAYRQGDAFYQPRYLSDSGRLFFNARDGLVPKDVNGQGDVYQYEPEGLGSCTSATSSGSDVYSAAAGGCVALISSGNSATESAFLDASESGGDVFFLTAGKLVGQDTDSALDIYDAQECTAETPCQPASAVASPPCTTEASCKAAPTPQPESFGPSGSATFSGAGNVVPELARPSKTVAKKAVKCKRGFVKNKKGQCRKKRKSKKAKKSAHANRRTSR